MGLINIGEAGEQTISNASGVVRCPRNTAKIDLSSGIQVKTAQTYPDKGKLEAYFASESTSPLIQTIRNKIRKFAKELKRILKFVKVIKKLITAIQELIKLAAEILKWLISLPAIIASIVAQCASELISELKSAIAGGIVSGIVSDTQPPSIIDRFSDSFQNVQDQFDITANATQDFFNEISLPSVEEDIINANNLDTSTSRP
jgi:hypothetical protein